MRRPAVLATLALLYGCIAPVGPASFDEGLIPEHCGHYARKDYAVPESDAEWAAIANMAGELWFKHTDGCVVATAHVVPDAGFDKRICREDTLRTSAGSRLGPDGRVHLGEAAHCVGTSIDLITLWPKEIGDDLEYKLTVVSHEIGHTVGFQHGGVERCIMYKDAWHGAGWCQADELQCRKLMYCGR